MLFITILVAILAGGVAFYFGETNGHVELPQEEIDKKGITIKEHDITNVDKTVETTLFKDTEKGFEFEYPSEWVKPTYVKPQLTTVISSDPLWQLDIARKVDEIDLTDPDTAGKMPSGYEYILAAYPLEEYDALKEKAKNSGVYTFEEFNLDGHKGFFTTDGGTCLYNVAYIFGPSQIFYLGGCDQRNYSDPEKNKQIGLQTMNLILSTFNIL